MKSLAELAVENLKAQGLKEGSIVKVLYKIPSKTQGWSNTWTVQMDSMIGKELKVLSIGSCGIYLECIDFRLSFPPQCLEFVDKVEFYLNQDYTCEINYSNKTVKVGCQYFTFKKIKELNALINAK